MQPYQTPLVGDNYRIELIGVDAPDYFPGRSAVDTPYDEVFIGQSYDAAGAYDDAYEGIRQDLKASVIEQIGLPERLPAGNYPPPVPMTQSDEEREADLHYYVAVYVKLPPAPPKVYAVFASPIGKNRMGVQVVTVEDCALRWVGSLVGKGLARQIAAELIAVTDAHLFPLVVGEPTAATARRLDNEGLIDLHIHNPFA